MGAAAPQPPQFLWACVLIVAVLSLLNGLFCYYLVMCKCMSTTARDNVVFNLLSS